MLVARLLASSTDTTSHHDAYQFLREARGVTFKWLGELSVKLQQSEIGSEILDYQQRVCEMAAICRATYDVDPLHLTKLLSDAEDYFILISCFVTLYDNQPPTIENMPASLQVLLCRDTRLAHKTAPVILKALKASPRILDQPVSKYWNGYQPGSSGWVSLSAPNSRWVSTTTKRMPEQSPQQVHLNLLEGRLLVHGKPLGRLPQEYVMHPTYTRLFAHASHFTVSASLSSNMICHMFEQKVLDVVPANYPGMAFVTRTDIEGNLVN
jgi:hypothetical protein